MHKSTFSEPQHVLNIPPCVRIIGDFEILFQCVFNDRITHSVSICSSFLVLSAAFNHILRFTSRTTNLEKTSKSKIASTILIYSVSLPRAFIIIHAFLLIIWRISAKEQRLWLSASQNLLTMRIIASIAARKNIDQQNRTRCYSTTFYSISTSVFKLISCSSRS